jgi:protein phosphatase
MRTDQGRVRDHNEDFIASREPTDPDDVALNGWIYILADGVGGADAGEIASQYATERTLYHYINDDRSKDWGMRLQNAIRAANADLRKMVDEEMDSKRMATTMVAVVIHESVASIANVGDSRGYHYQQGNLIQITKDQSLVARLLEEGAISEEEALNHPRKNVILHSIGPESKPQIDYFEVNLEPGECIVLCSDGLTRHVLDEEIKLIVEADSPDVATKKLIELANERGGEDNISVAVLLLGEESQSLKDSGDDPVMVSGPDPTNSSRARRILWRYIAFLVIIQVILLVLIWNLLSS